MPQICLQRGMQVTQAMCKAAEVCGYKEESAGEKETMMQQLVWQMREVQREQMPMVREEDGYDLAVYLHTTCRGHVHRYGSWSSKLDAKGIVRFWAMQIPDNGHHCVVLWLLLWNPHRSMAPSGKGNSSVQIGTQWTRP